ncbi:hypothetical protein LWI28_008377 [Acer negundo]|uniref:Reverse transcriptase domain-containing protein n=1 Tax=Acer negundo TaxID=4023 RepID=A0AAD5I920_ACENE|nr:hypothetical protein LWI28_008377 [Acer negundo]
MNVVLGNIKESGVRLRSWNSNNRRSLKEDIYKLKWQLREACSNITAGSWRKIQSIESQLDLALETDERYWRQRSRIEWLKCGDRNTRFFHMKVSMRKSRNIISDLLGNDGNWYDSKIVMEKIIIDYFSNLFQSSMPSQSEISAALVNIKSKLSIFLSSFLESNFTAVEITQAVFELGALKAPGRDSLSALFYQKFGKVPERITDFRPISLCEVIYKVVVKAIANRIKRRKRKRGSMAIKLEMYRAYDRVEWIFVENLMCKLGFPMKWIRLVMRCISSVSYSFILNGDICGSVIPTRGLRQGDPISSYLFILCAEGFSSLVNLAVERGDIQGFRCSRYGPMISHLFFVDDSLLFTKASVSNCGAIKSILGVYAAASGQVINFNKSAFCVSPSISCGERAMLADILGVVAVDCHERYLGLPCFTGRKKKEIFSDILSKIWDKIKGWHDKFLSIGGKEILIKAVIQSIPSYAMHLFQLPKGLLSEIYRLCACFW